MAEDVRINVVRIERMSFLQENDLKSRYFIVSIYFNLLLTPIFVFKFRKQLVQMSISSGGVIFLQPMEYSWRY